MAATMFQFSLIRILFRFYQLFLLGRDGIRSDFPELFHIRPGQPAICSGSLLISCSVWWIQTALWHRNYKWWDCWIFR